jgi:hypothetical protein
VSERWDWTRRFRIWEANRKVFLEPENWLEPEPKEGAAQPPPVEPKSRLRRRRRGTPEPEQRE